MSHEVLVLVAHGSHQHAASSVPARQLAAMPALQGRFGQVVAAFLKEFPAYGDLRYLVDGGRVFVVPLFMAEGYFSGRVVPRELGLDGPVTRRDGTTWYYTRPIGTAERLTELIADQAVALASGVAAADLAVVVVGHGTTQSRQSAAAVHEHVERLQSRHRFAEVAAAFLDESPPVDQVVTGLTAANVVVVPLFMGDGLHSDVDVPRLLGLHRGGRGEWRQPSPVAGRRLWYAGSLGARPEMAEVVLARVAEARAAAGLAPAPAGVTPQRPRWCRTFESWLDAQSGPVTVMDVTVSPTGAGRFAMAHRCGAAGPPADLRILTRHTAAGDYRALPFAGDLPDGWQLRDLTAAAVADGLDALYPGALAAWAAERDGRLQPGSWAATAGRQGGAPARLAPAAVEAAVAELCLGRPCRRRPVWGLTDGAPAVAASAGEVPCHEPCSLLLSRARQAAPTSPDAV